MVTINPRELQAKIPFPFSESAPDKPERRTGIPASVPAYARTQTGVLIRSVRAAAPRRSFPRNVAAEISRAAGTIYAGVETGLSRSSQMRDVEMCPRFLFRGIPSTEPVSEVIQWTFHPAAALAHDMGVNHGGGDIFMAE